MLPWGMLNHQASTSNLYFFAFSLLFQFIILIAHRKNSS